MNGLLCSTRTLGSDRLGFFGCKRLKVRHSRLVSRERFLIQSQGISKLSRSVESISMKFLNLCQLGLLGDYRLYGLAVLAFHTRFPNLQS